jgi:hypothetical protein
MGRGLKPDLGHEEISGGTLVGRDFGLRWHGHSYGFDHA